MVGFSMSSTIFGLQTSYKLGFHWLFTLFVRILTRCSSWAQGELGSTPTFLTAIFLLPNLKKENNVLWSSQCLSLNHQTSVPGGLRSCLRCINISRTEQKVKTPWILMEWEEVKQWLNECLNKWMNSGSSVTTCWSSHSRWVRREAEGLLFSVLNETWR